MTTPLVSRREASPSLRPAYVNDLVTDVTVVRDAHDDLAATVAGMAGPWDVAGAAAAAQAAAEAASDSAGAAAAAQAAAEAASDPVGTATSVVTTAISALGLGTVSTHALTEFVRLGTDQLAANNPVVLAHRGGANTHPENTMEAFRTAVAQGVHAIEMDVQSLKDGTLAVMHDGTVDRTTTSTGNVADFTAEGWRALRVKVSAQSPGPVGGAIYQDGVLSVPTFDEVLREFGNRVLIVPEVKSTGVGTGAAMVAMLQRYRIQPSMALIQSFVLADLTAAVAAGYPTVYLGDGLDPATVAAAGVTYVGPSMASVTTPNVAAMTAVGVGVIPYTVYRRVDRDALVAKGVRGIFADEPVYLSRSTAMMTSDPYRNGTFPPGMLGDPVSNDRGTFIGLGGYRWGIQTSSSAGRFCLQGWACPIATPTAYTLGFTLTWDGLDGDTTRWASCHFAEPDDKGYTDQSGTSTQQSGYHLLLRENGTLALYRTDIGVGVTLLNSASTAAVSQGQQVPITIQVTPTQVIATRTDTGGSVTVTDNTYRGGYFHFGKSGANVKASWSGVTIT